MKKEWRIHIYSSFDSESERDKAYDAYKKNFIDYISNSAKFKDTSMSKSVVDIPDGVDGDSFINLMEEKNKKK
jgi:hypothetical protein